MRIAGPLVSLWCTGMLACAGAGEGAATAGGEPSAGADSTAGVNEGVDEVQSGITEPTPALDAGRYVLRLGDVELVVEPSIGGRVTRFSLAGENILTGPEVVADGEGSTPNMYGSTFWTSPQSAWGWPPEAAIDTASHQARVDGAVLELASEAGATTGYAVRKRFWVDAARKHISIEYTLENQRAALPAAPWEISRVPKEGFVFFASSSAALPASTLPSTLRDGVAWVDIAAAPALDSKLFQDGSEGWLAYVYRGLVFIKTFDDLGADEAAPSEAEIEVFVSGNFEYVEVEQQGRYTLPPAGGTSSWQVNWVLERLPAGVDPSIGSGALVAWVRSRVASAR
jgi:hypothetical protein